jgi:hypothetical protein
MPMPPSNAIYVPIVIGGDTQTNEWHAKSKAESKVVIKMTSMVPKLEVLMSLPTSVVDLDHICRLIS